MKTKLLHRMKVFLFGSNGENEVFEDGANFEIGWVWIILTLPLALFMRIKDDYNLLVASLSTIVIVEALLCFLWALGVI